MTLNRPNTARPGTRAIPSSDAFCPRLTPLAAALQALLVSMAIGAAALPQPARAQAAATTLPAGDAIKTFNVPAGPLDAALDRFARTAEVNLSYDAALISGLTTKGLTGNHRVASALSLLLAGTGVEAVAQAGGGYSLRKAPEVVRGTASGARTEPTLPEVRVTASPESGLPKPYAGGQVARGGQVGMLGNKDVMDTPFSQTHYTNKTIQDQQAQTVQEVLLNDPSILTKQNSASDEDGSIAVRGFSNTLSSGFGTLNGLAGMSPLRSPDMDYIERVEVLRGPSALLNGMAASGAGGIGGSFNLVTKQAGDEPLTQLTTRYASRSQLGAHLDVGRRFGAEKQFGIRFNGAYREGDTAVEPISAEVGSAAINMDYRGERVRMSADIAHHSNEASPQVVQQLVVSGVGGSFVFVPRAPTQEPASIPCGADNPAS